MITWVSDRSGIASSVTFWMDHTPTRVAIPTNNRTMNLLCAHASMILLIMGVLLRFHLVLGVVHRRLFHWRLVSSSVLGVIHRRRRTADAVSDPASLLRRSDS